MLVGQASFDEGGNSLSPPLSHPGVGVLTDLQQVTSLGRAHTHTQTGRGERERSDTSHSTHTSIAEGGGKSGAGGRERERKKAILIERERDVSQGQFKQYGHRFSQQVVKTDCMPGIFYSHNSEIRSFHLTDT